MTNWQIGDEAVCVDDSPCPCCGKSCPGLASGGVYTVTDVFVDLDGFGDEYLFLELAELPPEDYGSRHPGNQVAADSFRKVRKLDQSFDFRELIKTPEPA